MLSISSIKSASNAAHYHSTENYYSKEEGLEHSAWSGKGAASLGLEGKIKEADFVAILEGKIGGLQLGKTVLNEKGEKVIDHRPGTDLTFSAPKSVSILSEILGQGKVREAHEKAVDAALNYIEKTVIQARVTRHGTTMHETTGNMIVAKFSHDTSRALDPQTHTHCVIANATKCADGEWRSVSNEDIYNRQKTADAIYKMELSASLQQLGYEIDRTHDDGRFEVRGFTKEQLEAFSQRSQHIEDRLRAKGIDPATASAGQRETAALETRTAKRHVDREQLVVDWRDRAREVGIEGENIITRATTIEREGGVQRADQITGLQAIKYAVDHLTERESVVGKDAIVRTALQHGVGRVESASVFAAYDQLHKKGDLIHTPEGNVTTPGAIKAEHRLIDTITKGKGVTTPIAGNKAIERAIIKHEAVAGYPFTPGQWDASKLILTSPDRVVGVQGYAGTGKTTMATLVKDVAEEHGTTVRGMAQSASAASRLKEETGIPAQTVARFLIDERLRQNADTKLLREGIPPPARGRELWMVDESSFLGQKDANRLLGAAEKANAKVVLLGDVRQLSAIDAGKPFEVAQRSGMATAMMTDINRQQDKVLIEAVARTVQRKNMDAFNHLDSNGLVIEERNVKDEPDRLVPRIVADITDKSPAERESALVITAYNRDRKAINEGVRGTLKERGEIAGDHVRVNILESKGWTDAQTKSAQYYKPGDIVRFGRDYNRIGVVKGEYATVKTIDAERGTVYLEGSIGDVITWRPQKNSMVEVYQPDSRELMQGDVIRITRNGQDVANGDVGKVQSVRELKDDSNGLIAADAVVSIKGKGDMQINLLENRHWEHAYASTIHSAQGQTANATAFLIRTTKGQENDDPKNIEFAKIFGERSFYVGTTRPRRELKIYTNDKSAAGRAVGIEQNKTSALEHMRGEQAEVRPEISQGRGMGIGD